MCGVSPAPARLRVFGTGLRLSKEERKREKKVTMVEKSKQIELLVLSVISTACRSLMITTGLPDKE